MGGWDGGMGWGDGMGGWEVMGGGSGDELVGMMSRLQAEHAADREVLGQWLAAVAARDAVVASQDKLRRRYLDERRRLLGGMTKRQQRLVEQAVAGVGVGPAMSMAGRQLAIRRLRAVGALRSAERRRADGLAANDAAAREVAKRLDAATRALEAQLPWAADIVGRGVPRADAGF